MAGERVVLPGGRDVRGTLEGAGAADCVVACPPHPELGGSSADPRIRAMTDALVERGIATLRFDYGPWSEGDGESRDAVSAIEWARDHFDAVGVVGYSFGAGVAIIAAGRTAVGALTVLAPPSSIGSIDVPVALEAVDVPMQVIVGERDGAVEWRSILDAVDPTATIERLDADHLFIGRRPELGTLTADFFVAHLR